MSATLRIQADDLSDLIASVDDLGGAVTRPELFQLVGDNMREVILDHLAGLASDSEHHQTSQSLGAEPTGFYARAAQAVQSPEIEGDEGVSVSIDHQGLAQRYFGGTISAKSGGYLTIPARAEAYGVRARELDFLKLIIFPSGLAALVDRDEKAHEGGVYYWLVRSVTQQGDKTVLPSDAQIIDPALQKVRDYISDIWGERRAA